MPTSYLQRAAIILPIAFLVMFFIMMKSSERSGPPPETRSLMNAKKICVACRRYAADHNASFPPSLEALFPNYLSDRAVLASPFKPSEPMGYSYTPPPRERINSHETVVIEDKFAPAAVHDRIVSYADDSAQIIHPSPP